MNCISSNSGPDLSTKSRDVIGSQSITPNYYCSSSGEFDPIRRFSLIVSPTFEF